MANFLSQLSPEWLAQALGGAATVAPVNTMEGLNNAPVPQAPSAPVVAPARQPRERRSVLDTVGRVADVLAKVGGADALYQPTLDAREDRQLALADHARMVDLDALKLATAQGTLGDANNQRLGQAVKGLQAIQARGGNVAAAWPLLARQMGIPDDRVAQIGEAIATNPDALAGLSAVFGQQKEFGLQPFYAKDQAGNLVAYQMSKDGTVQPVTLPEGQAPVDPLKFVDTGGTMTGVGTRSGTVSRILPKTEAPGRAADRASRENIATAGNASRERIAGMPARSAGKTGTGTDKGAEAAAGNQEALIALDNLENGFKDLHRMNALPGDNGGVMSNVLSAIGRTGPGQYVGEQIGDAAAQKRVALGKTVNTLQQTLIKALPASATRTKFEQEILAKSLPDPSRMSLETAQSVIGDYRAIFKRAQAAAAKENRPIATPRPKLTPRKTTGGNSGGWSVVGVK